MLKPVVQLPSPLILSFFISPPQVNAYFSVSAVKLVSKLLFFNVIESGGLYSLIYITTHSPHYLSLCVGHNSQSTEHMILITLPLTIKAQRARLIRFSISSTRLARANLTAIDRYYYCNDSLLE